MSQFFTPMIILTPKRIISQVIELEQNHKVLMFYKYQRIHEINKDTKENQLISESNFNMMFHAEI